MSTAARLYRSMSRGARARKGAGIPLLAEQYDYANWRETCAKLADDPEVTNRLIQQALYFLGVGPRKHAFDRNLVETGH